MKHYHLFAAVHDKQQEFHQHEHIAYRAHVIPDDRTEASCDRSHTRSATREEINDPPRMHKEDEENITNFFEGGHTPTIILDDESDMLVDASPEAELLRWHYMLGRTFCKVEDHGSFGHLAKKTCHSTASQVCRMHNWGNNQDILET
jgi:hypothetical protein